MDPDTYEVSASGNELSVELSNVDASRLYVLRVTTAIDNPDAYAVGDFFTNTVHVDNLRSTTSADLLSRRSGSAGGDQLTTKPPTEPTEPSEPTELAATGATGIEGSVVGALALLPFMLALMRRAGSRQH